MQTLLALVILAATLPLGALLFWNESEQARDQQIAATSQALQLAQHAAVQTDGHLEDTLQLLDRLAVRPTMRAMDPAACDPVFSEFPSQFPRYANLVLVNAEGGGVCASAVLVPGANTYAHFPSIRAIADGADHSIEPPTFGPKTKRWISAATVAVRDEAGQRRGTLTITIDLERFPLPPLHREPLSGPAIVELVDRSGTRVAGTREAGTIGTKVAEPLIAALEDGPPRTLRLQSSDGEAELVAVVPVRSAPWFAVAHLPLGSAIAPARARLAEGLGIATLMIVVIWIVASLLIRRMLRPLHEIADVATAVAAGDATARVRVRGPSEIAAIGAGFNRMLDQRAQADSAVRAGEARYRSLFETSSDAIIGLGLDNRIIFANPAVEQLTGWRPDELVGEYLSVLQPPALREPHLNAIRRFASEPGATLRRRSTETRCLHRDGHELPVEVTFSSAEIDGTAVFVGFMRDITERHAALAGLRESEQRFRVMADSSPVLVWTADAVVQEFYFNATWLAFTGQTLDEAREAGWYGGVHPDDAIAVQEVIDRANLRHEGCTLEYRRLRHDGEYRWVLDTSAPRFDEGGRFLGYVGTAVDIHDRVIAESRIRRLTTLYSALSQANEAIARSTDLTALLQTVCEIVVTQTGITTAMVALLDESGSRFRDVAYSGEFAKVLTCVPLRVAGAPPGEESPGSLVIRTNRRHVSADRHSDTSVCPIVPLEAHEVLRSSAVYPLQRQDVPVGVLAVYSREVAFFDSELTDLLDLLAKDLSYALEAFAARERRDLAEDQLKRLNATLEERVAERTRSLEAANRELEAFSYSVSHDLRAPLRGISGFSQLLHEGYVQKLDDTGRSYLERVKSASAKMARLIDDLLNLSRIARQAIHRADIDISALAEEAVAELREADPSRKIAVSITPGLKAHADPGLTRIVLANLLDNAWKFTSRTQGALVTVEATTIGGRPGFTVRDNGAGFDPSYAEKLFAPFQRLHGESEFAGTGIGLAIVQRIVHRHGGEVHVDAAPGEGASFSFTLGS
jgi:PAS domain S-box-containing protein